MTDALPTLPEDHSPGGESRNKASTCTHRRAEHTAGCSEGAFLLNDYELLQDLVHDLLVKKAQYHLLLIAVFWRMAAHVLPLQPSAQGLRGTAAAGTVPQAARCGGSRASLELRLADLTPGEKSVRGQRLQPLQTRLQEHAHQPCQRGF